MSEKNFSELEIDRYLEGLMEETERADFETRIGKDAELRNEVYLQRSIIKAVRKEQLLKIVHKEENRIKKQGKVRKLVFSIGSLAIAASLIGFFYIGYLNSCETIANSYYMAYAYTPITSRGGETLPLTKSDSLFFDALKQLEKGKSSLAINQLTDLQNNPKEMNAATDQAVKWYLSLAYLKNGNKAKAKGMLQLILKEPSGEFYIKAEELLKEINN